MKKTAIVAILLSSALSASPIQEYGDWDAPAHTATGLSTRKGKEPLEKEGHRDALEAVNHRPGSSSAPSTLENLPPEVLCTIFSFLEFEDINNVMSSSAEFANIIKNNHQIFLGKRRSFRELIKIKEMGPALFPSEPRPVSGISVDLADYGALHEEINREELSLLAYASEIYNAGGLLLVTPLEDIKLLLGNGKTKLDFGLGRKSRINNEGVKEKRYSAIPESIYDIYYSEYFVNEKLKLCMDANCETLRFFAYDDLSTMRLLGMSRVLTIESDAFCVMESDAFCALMERDAFRAPMESDAFHALMESDEDLSNAWVILKRSFDFIERARFLTRLTELHWHDPMRPVHLEHCASLPLLEKLIINVENVITPSRSSGASGSITPFQKVRELYLNLTDPLSARFAHAQDDACLYREIPNMFPNLETLYFGKDSTENLKTEDLDALRDTLPRLTHLTYANPKYTDMSQVNRDHFAAALSVGQESLRTLNMFAYEPSGPNSLEVLLGYNHLESLTVPIWEPFFQWELQYNVLRVIISLPHLKDFTLKSLETLSWRHGYERISNKSLTMLTQGSSLETLTLAGAYLSDPFDTDLFLMSDRLKKLRLVDCGADASGIDALKESQDIQCLGSDLFDYCVTGTIDVSAMRRRITNVEEARHQEYIQNHLEQVNIRTLLDRPWSLASDCVAQALGHTQRAVDSSIRSVDQYLSSSMLCCGQYLDQPSYYVPYLNNAQVLVLSGFGISTCIAVETSGYGSVIGNVLTLF